MSRKKEQSLAAEFGARLRAMRKRNGWTQKELADRLEVTVSQVSRWETGKILPNMDTQIDMREVFKVTMDEISRGVGAVRGELLVDVELRELIGIIEQLDIHYRNETRETLRSIIAKARQDGATALAEAAATPKKARR